MLGEAFDIYERREYGEVRLTVTGDLDRRASVMLEDRLTRLRAKKSAVRLDLSGVDFIDCTGLRLLIGAVGDSKTRGWQLEIERQITPNVRRLFRLAHFDPFVVGDNSS